MSLISCCYGQNLQLPGVRAVLTTASWEGKFDLEALGPYPTGGFSIQSLAPFYFVRNAVAPLCDDCECAELPDPLYGVKLDCSDPCDVKLRLFDQGVEVADGFDFPADTTVDIILIGA